MSELDIEKAKLSRGKLAQQVIENPLYGQAFVAIKAGILAELEETTFKQNEERDELWRQLQTLKKLEGVFNSLINTGKMADHNITLLQRAKTGFKTVMG